MAESSELEILPIFCAVLYPMKINKVRNEIGRAP